MVISAHLVGCASNAPGKGWRPHHLGGVPGNPDNLVLTAEPSPNAAGFLDGIIATPPSLSDPIIGRVKGDVSGFIAPLMRREEIRVQANFDWEKFNLRAWLIAIDVFSHSPVETRTYIERFEYLT